MKTPAMFIGNSIHNDNTHVPTFPWIIATTPNNDTAAMPKKKEAIRFLDVYNKQVMLTMPANEVTVSKVIRYSGLSYNELLPFKNFNELHDSGFTNAKT
jgi:hypothetical protein